MRHTPDFRSLASLVAIPLLAQAACASLRARQGVDPDSHEVVVVALLVPRELAMLEHTTRGSEHTLELYTYDLERSERRDDRVPVLARTNGDGDGEGTTDRQGAGERQGRGMEDERGRHMAIVQEVASVIAHGEDPRAAAEAAWLASALESGAALPFTPIAEGALAVTPRQSLGAAVPALTLRLEGDRVMACAEADCTVAVYLGSDDYTSVRWLQAAAAPVVVLEALFPGRPTVRASHPIRLTIAASRILALRGFAAHQAGNYDTAANLWQTAFGLDPTSASTAYNLACAHARRGDLTTALSFLRQAIALGGRRYYDWAHEDSDLLAVRSQPDFALLAPQGRMGSSAGR